MKTTTLKNTLLTGLALASAFITGAAANLEERPPIVSEIHYITDVTETAVHGENITASGEGIYYTLDQINELTGGEPLEIGDKVEIQWTEESLMDEDWDEVYSFRIVGDNQ